MRLIKNIFAGLAYLRNGIAASPQILSSNEITSTQYPQYTIIFDCGSSGTRGFLYKTEDAENNVELADFEVEPGMHSLKDQQALQQVYAILTGLNNEVDDLGIAEQIIPGAGTIPTILTIPIETGKSSKSFKINPFFEKFLNF